MKKAVGYINAYRYKKMGVTNKRIKFVGNDRLIALNRRYHIDIWPIFEKKGVKAYLSFKNSDVKRNKMIAIRENYGLWIPCIVAVDVEYEETGMSSYGEYAKPIWIQTRGIVTSPIQNEQLSLIDKNKED